ncbi:MAG TPA: hypothetical protein VHL57_00120, partial [Flavobacteriales bacterium]|nr:hypothetical protein [Flavobacteriales bacterium]
HDLEAYGAAGKYVVLDFFFYDCGPCQQHAPYYSELFQTYGCNSGDLICIEVNFGDPDADATAFSEDFAPGFAHPPVIGSATGDLLVTEYGIPAFPTFCLIGPGREMIVNDIWPLADMSTFVNAFPDGADITEQPCLVGIDERASAAALAVRPTLTDGPVTVNYRGPSAQRVEVTVFDLLGHPVPGTTTVVQRGVDRTLDLRALANGQYILHVIADGRVVDARRVALVR